jgi:hypothetical protein
LPLGNPAVSPHDHHVRDRLGVVRITDASCRQLTESTTSFSLAASFCKFTNSDYGYAGRISRYQWKATPIAGPLMVRLELWEEK